MWVFFNKINKIKKIGFLIMINLLILLNFVSVVRAGINKDLIGTKNPDLDPKVAFEKFDKTTDSAGKKIDFYTRIGQIIGLIYSIIGVIAFAFILYGGWQWMTAGGNSDQVENAKKLIIQTVLALIVLLLAYLITNLIVNLFISSDLFYSLTEDVNKNSVPLDGVSEKYLDAGV